MIKTIRGWLECYDVEMIWIDKDLKLDQKMLKPFFIMSVWCSDIGLTEESLTEESLDKLVADGKGLYYLYANRYSGWENEKHNPYAYYEIMDTELHSRKKDKG